MPLAFEKYDAEHQKLWDTMKIIRDAQQLDATAKKIIAHKAVYEAVERDTGVPWQLVAVIHIRESGLGDVGKFLKGIHNGQSWKIKATIIPKIGPFKSWHECALAALKRTGLSSVGKGNWTPAKMVSAAEPYNGYGYRNKGLRSPYLWASTNHQQRGKYVRDGVFDGSVMDTQLGVAAMLKFLGVGADKKTSVPVIVTRDVVLTQGPTWTLMYFFQEYALPILIVGGVVTAFILAYRALKDNK
jgi:lysozyme family protein